jgi:UDP-glucose 4-epimerase/UDP-glucuronate decarboxylase
MDIAAPRWSYAASKIAGESMVFAAAAEHGLAPLVLRFHNVYGPRMGPTHVISEFAQRIHARVEPFPVYGLEQTRSFLHVSDAARAILLVDQAARAGKTGIYNIGSDEEVQIASLARQMLDLVERHPHIEGKPAPVGSVGRRVPDITKLRSLGFAPQVPLARGLREVLDAYERRAVLPLPARLSQDGLSSG